MDKHVISHAFHFSTTIFPKFLTMSPLRVKAAVGLFINKFFTKCNNGFKQLSTKPDLCNWSLHFTKLGFLLTNLICNTLDG